MIYEGYEGEIMFGWPKSILRWDDWWMSREQWSLFTLILVKSFSTDQLRKFKLSMWVLSWTESQLNCWVQRNVIDDMKSCQRPGPSAVSQGPYWVQYNFINDLDYGTEDTEWEWGFDAPAGCAAIQGDLRRWRNGSHQVQGQGSHQVQQREVPSFAPWQE